MPLLQYFWLGVALPGLAVGLAVGHADRSRLQQVLAGRSKKDT